MSEHKNQGGLTRRDLFKTAAAAGAGALLSRTAALASGQSDDAKEKHPAVPTRPFGKTGVDVPILALGGMVDTANNQLLLKQALQWGVNYWDTAPTYLGDRSEKGFGKFFSRNPDKRKNVFLVTKSKKRDPRQMTQLLDRSLERMRTDYIDLYLVHMVKSGRELRRWASQWKSWSQKAKADKKIRFFGFSTHTNMADCMSAAATLGWIDGVMTSYNYRLMHDDDMKAAVAACTKAGIGLTAMKTQARGMSADAQSQGGRLLSRLLDKGFTDAQARLKAVWKNTRIASICSQMPNMTILMSNVAAAMDKTELSAGEMELMRRDALATASQYCAGCGAICERAVGGEAPVCDVLRYLMYYNSYGERDRARELFAALPQRVRDRLASLDYLAAERSCPQGIAITKAMRQAGRLLA